MDVLDSRRKFIKDLAAAAAAILVGRVGVSAMQVSPAEPFRLLVAGDSFIWGQGLLEQDKIHTLIAEWLRSSPSLTSGSVEIKVKAHSGSTVKFHADAEKAYRQIGRDENFPYPPEVNIGFPSLTKQIETAAAEYAKDGASSAADMILVSGGITDISVAKLLGPSTDEKTLPALIDQHCRVDMTDALRNAAELHPNALLVVVGYFPIVSPQTSASRLFNSWLETMNFSRPLKPIANNALTRKLIFSGILKKVIRVSRMWKLHSDKGLSAAVDAVNSGRATRRAIFVASPITEDTCLETPNTLLFRMGKKGRTEDPLYDQRSRDCDTALPELKRSTGLDHPIRYCEMAAVGHPNPRGAKAYADAIKATISAEMLARRAKS